MAPTQELARRFGHFRPDTRDSACLLHSALVNIDDIILWPPIDQLVQRIDSRLRRLAVHDQRDFIFFLLELSLFEEYRHAFFIQDTDVDPVRERHIFFLARFISLAFLGGNIRFHLELAVRQFLPCRLGGAIVEQDDIFKHVVDDVLQMRRRDGSNVLEKMVAFGYGGPL